VGRTIKNKGGRGVYGQEQGHVRVCMYACACACVGMRVRVCGREGGLGGWVWGNNSAVKDECRHRHCPAMYGEQKAVQLGRRGGDPGAGRVERGMNGSFRTPAGPA
jgi:hypothetical protein